MQLVRYYNTPAECSEDGRGQVGSLHPPQEVQLPRCPLSNSIRLLTSLQLSTTSAPALSGPSSSHLWSDPPRVSNRGLSTQPWGETILRVMMLEDYGLSVTNAKNQLHRGVVKPSSPSLHTRCYGMIVLNAELMSKNSIHTCMFFSST